MITQEDFLAEKNNHFTNKELAMQKQAWEEEGIKVIK